MKNLIFFAALLIFISDNVISAEAAKDDLPDSVLDLDGNELKTGTSYYIAPTFRPGGGVSIYPIANKTCTYAVAQLPVLGAGLPVTFRDRGTDQGEVVRESTDITIGFSFGILFCPDLWKVDEYDEAAKQHFVTAGAFDGNLTSINIWFQIRKDPTFLDSYRFVFCPKEICTDVGIYIGNDRVRRFALGGNFRFSTFTFKKFQPCTNSNALEA